jgi:hypothetical protein
MRLFLARPLAGNYRKNLSATETKKEDRQEIEALRRSSRPEPMPPAH